MTISALQKVTLVGHVEDKEAVFPHHFCDSMRLEYLF